MGHQLLRVSSYIAIVIERNVGPFVANEMDEGMEVAEAPGPPNNVADQVGTVFQQCSVHCSTF